MIRLARPDDAPAIQGVMSAAFSPHRKDYPPAAYAVTVPDVAALGRRLKDGLVWVAETDRIVGTLTGVHDRGLYLRSMAVDPGAQGQGVGQALLQASFAYAEQQGIKRVWLRSSFFLHAALALYRKEGFVECGKDDLHGMPLIVMELAVGTNL